MNDRFGFFTPTGANSSAPRNRHLAAAFDFARRGIALSLIALLVPLSSPAAWGQQEPPPPPPDQSQSLPPEDQGPPPQAWNPLNPQQLDQLVAPIALYPDSLVAQVLAGATYPSQVTEADRFVQANQGVPPAQLSEMANSQPWDPSIKALTAFPSVLDNMDRNLDWTTQLGNAYYNQPQDVMEAVQAMRSEAYQRGDLRSTPQLTVSYTPGDIVIEPANPAVVYVPYYNPWTVWGFRPWYAYYMPPRPPGLYFAAGLGIGFGFGVAVVAWSHWGWGWGHWHPAWGPHPYIAYNHYTYVSRSVTVVNHGYYGRFDRSPQARAFNRQVYQRARANAYRNGFAAGQRNGYNAGARRGYNAGQRNGYNAGERNGFNRGYNRGTANHPAQNFNRRGNRPNNNYSYRPQNRNRNFNRQGANRNRPAANRRARPQARPRNNARSHGNDHSHRR